MVRYCRRCDTEFQPHVARCSDCGGELEDQHPDVTVDGPAPVQEEATADATFVTVATDLSASKAERVARKLGGAGIQFRIGARGYHFVLAVPEDDQAAARLILLRARAIPREPVQDQPAVGETGGPCPACSDFVAGGSTECPGCGLNLGAETEVCEKCGGEVVPPGEPCKQCAGAIPSD